MSQLNNSFGNISLTESEIIYTLCCASPLSETNSEKELKSSPPSLMSAQLIGSSHGPKRLLFPSLIVSSKNSINFSAMPKPRSPWKPIWVTSILWLLKFVIFTWVKWEDRCMWLPSHILPIWLLTKNCIYPSITENSMSKKKITRSVLTRLMKLLFLSLKWRSNSRRKMFFFKMPPSRLINYLLIWKLKTKKLRSSKMRSKPPLLPVLNKPLRSSRRKLPLWETLKMPCPPCKLLRMPSIIWTPKILLKWSPITSPILSSNIFSIP